MAKVPGHSSGEDENVSAKLPATELEAEALKPAIAVFLRSIPPTWSEFDPDTLTTLQSNALFLLTAAGMVERRGWIRATIANHSTCFELRFQSTGERGFVEVMERAGAFEFETWANAWRKWSEGPTQQQSPFHAQDIKPQEWRLTDQGEMARDELNGKVPRADPSIVSDYVLKRGVFGPGYWARRLSPGGRPLSAAEQRDVQRLMEAGHDLTLLPRPPAAGSGRLLEIRKVEHAASAQPVTLTNWQEGASAFADAFVDKLGPTFKSLDSPPPASDSKGQPQQVESSFSRAPATTSDSTQVPKPFRGGELVYYADRVLLCGVDICSGPRTKRLRATLELLRATKSGGGHRGYSCEELAAKLGVEHGEKKVPGIIRQLRQRIGDALRNAGFTCGLEDVILSGGPGYRFADCVSVQCVPMGSPGGINVPDDPNVSNDSDVPDGRVVRDENADRRQVWILDQLGNGVQLKLPHVMREFRRSRKTAQRDLDRLRDAGKIEFVGDARTGFYRLCEPPLRTGRSRRKPGNP